MRSVGRFSALSTCALFLALFGLSWSPANGATQIDRSFGESGVSFASRLPGMPSISAAEDIALTSRGRIVALGNDSNGQMVLARFSGNGRIDKTFGRSGLSYTARFNRDVPLGFGRGIAITKRGGILSTGTLGFVQHIDPLSRYQSSFAARLAPSGGLDKSYATSGNRELKLGGLNPNAGLRSQALSLSKDGHLYVVGQAIHSLHRTAGFVAKLTPNGRLDKEYKGSKRTRSSTRGIVEIRTKGAGHTSIAAARSLNRGKVLLTGAFSGSFMAARLAKLGGHDPTFNKGQIRTIDVDGDPECGCSFARAMARDRQGRIVIAGYTIDETTTEENARLAVVRLKSDGTLDRSFGSNGIARPQLPDYYESEGGIQLQRFLTTGVAVQTDGRIVISGDYNYRFSLVRLKRDGSLDPTFFDQGVFADWIRGDYGAAWDVVVDTKDRILASGGTDDGNFVLMRFTN